MKRTALARGQDRRLPGPPRLPLLDDRPRARSSDRVRTARPARPAGRGPLLRRHARARRLALAAAARAALGCPRRSRKLTGLVPGRHLLQQLPPEQHRRRHRPRARQLAAHRLDHDRLARRRGHRPHPRLRRALRPRRRRLRPRAAAPCAAWPAPGPCSSASASSSARPRLRLLPARAPPARLMALVRPRLACPGRASSSRSCRPPSTPTAQRVATSGRPASPASRSRRSSCSTTSRSPAPSRIPLPARGLLPDGPAVHARCRRCPSRSTAGACARALFTLYFAQVGLPRASALAFSLVGAGPHRPALALRAPSSGWPAAARRPPRPAAA